MAWSFLLSSSATSPVGIPRVATAGLSAISGSNVMMVALVSIRNDFFTGWGAPTATWNGVTMSQAVGVSGFLAGIGEARSYIFYLPVGTVAGLSANCVVSAADSDNDYAVQVTIAAYARVLQVSPVNGTSSSVQLSSTSISASVSSDPDDLILQTATFSEVSAGAAVTASDGQSKRTGISTTVGAPMSHMAGDDTADAGPNTSGDWGSFNSPHTYVIASFSEDPTPAPPNILNVNGGSFADPDEINLTVNGTDFDEPGTTNLYYADSATYATANTQVQTISGVTSATLNWDAINVGSIGEGDNFLFIVTDDGGGGEMVSPAFPILVGQAEVFAIRRVYTTDGTLGPVLVLPIDFDLPKAAVIRGNSSTAVDTVQNDAVYSLCLVDETTSVGLGIGSEHTPGEAHQREQTQGVGSLLIHDGGTGPHLVEGTPSLSAAGLTIDFTINTAGLNLEIFVIGGASVQAKVDHLAVNTSPRTGLGFRPDLLVGVTAGINSAQSGDSTFALLSFGLCIDPGTPQQWSLSSNQSGTTRNSVVSDGAFLGQLAGTIFDWQMAITSFDVDGYSWSGSDPDGFNALALRMPGRKFFLTTFNKDDVVPGTTQDLPDIGFEPGAFILVTAGKNAGTPSPALGGRWSIGFTTAEGQDVATAMALPDVGAMTAEQFSSFTNTVAVSSLSGQITALGEVTEFGQISTIKWINSLVNNTMLIGMFAIDATDFDDGGDIIGVHEY